MAKVESISVPLGDVAQNLQVNIRVIAARRFTLRLWLLRAVLAVAAIVSPVPVAVEMGEHQRDWDNPRPSRPPRP